MIMSMNTQKGVGTQDWHPADVKAALEKRGISLRQLAKAHGYSHFQRVLTSEWWAAEQIVAKALELEAKQIWPSRYPKDRDRGRAQQMTRNVAITRTGRIRILEGRP
jgi:Ner family transcriptional regulator